MAELFQITELMWPVHTIAELDPSVIAPLQAAGLRFKETSIDDESVDWAATVIDDGDEVVLQYRPAHPERPVELQSSWQEERTPAEVVSLFLERAGLQPNIVRWVAPTWPSYS